MAGGEPVHFVRNYEYLVKARERLFGWLRPLSDEQYTQEFPFGLHTLRATMHEIAFADWAYATRLRRWQEGERGIQGPLPAEDQWPVHKDRQTTFASLEPVWSGEIAPATRAVLSEITDWNAPLEYRIVRPDKTIYISTTTGEMATQLCFHEIHHRAQAMAMLRQLGVPAQNLDYSLLIFKRREEPAVPPAASD